MTPEDLDKLEALANAATPGPWSLRDGYGPCPDGLMRTARIANADHATVVGSDRAAMDLYGTKGDFEFIVTARAAIPALVAEVRRLRAVVSGGDHDYAEAYARGRADERAAIVAWLRTGKDWNTWVDVNGEPEEFSGDHQDLVREVARMIESGEHTKADR